MNTKSIKREHKFNVVNLSDNVIPQISEDTKTRYAWVPFGVFGQDDFWDAVVLAYNDSTTTSTCINNLADLIFGKGLYTAKPELQKAYEKLIPQEELKRVAFDLKLYGNAAFQVYWNDEHTKVIKFYHVPVQTLRAEKLYDNTRIENYYYCTDWKDQRKVRDKIKLPAFGTSNEKREILYIKDYSPNLYYYSLPDWVSALQYAIAEGELSNLHINSITNGFLPTLMINFNNGVPAPEERQTIEDLLYAKFTGTNNGGRFMVSFNDDKETAPTMTPIQVDNLHEKFQYVADYAQDRILVGHKITSPLLFGIRTTNNGFSSQSEEMKTAYSILQTMTISPFQNLLLNNINTALSDGGIEDLELYFEQLTPLVILSTTAEETGKTIDQVEDDVNDSMATPTDTDDGIDTEVIKRTDAEELELIRTHGTNSQYFNKRFN
jgi:hypothetical protein